MEGGFFIEIEFPFVEQCKFGLLKALLVEL